MIIPTWAGFLMDRPLVMGILNVTPDSFSDGGRFSGPDSAIATGRQLVASGADILDIGGESTRPNASPVAPEDEIARIVPVIRSLASEGAIISADTRNAVTMAAALAAGAQIINDISGLKHDAQAAKILADAACPVILMHMRGSPMTMTCQAHYADLVEDVLAELISVRDAAIAAGIAPTAIALDPGFGFAKIGVQNITLLRATARFAALGHPLLIGLSRKGFLGQLAGEADPIRRLPASLAAGLYALAQGANILRVHDVAATVQAIKVWRALTSTTPGSAKAS